MSNPQEDHKDFKERNNSENTTTPYSFTPGPNMNSTNENENETIERANMMEKSDKSMENLQNQISSEDTIVLCNNIPKKKNEVIKKILEISQRKGSDSNKQFLAGHEINFRCPFCGKYHENQYWKDKLGEKDYNQLIEEIEKMNKIAYKFNFT